MFIRIFFIAAFVGAPFTFVEAKTIVLIGDSMSEFAKDTVDQFCGNAKSTNRGVGGTTATQWQTRDQDSDLYVPTAIKSESGSCFDVVFVSLGANDQLETECTENLSAIRSRVASVLAQINKVCPSSTIYMTGYPTPRYDFEECGNVAKGADTRKYLNDPLKEACAAANKCKYDDASNIAGGSDSKLSPGQYHVDVVHINSRGYCKLWERESFRNVMGCTGAKTDCATVSTEEPQYDGGDATVGVALLVMVLATLIL